jgi:ABC-2 type transport system ATP-binding protein
VAAHRSSPAIRCEGLVKVYPGEVRAVDGLDLAVERGECFGLLGPNGAGKTTTVEILEGLIEPTQGQVEVLGLRWDSDERRLRSLVGVSLQETQLASKLTVRETVRLFRSFYRGGPDPDEVLDRLGLEEKRDTFVQNLSGGQRQRLALCCALAGDPELLFLDEPTTGLDPQARRVIWDLIRSLQDEGRTILLTTHYMEEAERLCGRVAVIDHGRELALGTPRDLIRSLGGEHILEVETDPPSAGGEELMLTLPGVSSVRRDQERLMLAVREPHRAIPALLELLDVLGLELASLRTHQATLDDVFVHLTGRSLRDA